MSATTAETWPHDALPLGAAVHGFQIDGVLGRGGFGITYLVHDLLDQRFALKECFPSQFARRRGSQVLPKSPEEAEPLADARRRFLEEAQALVRLGALAGSGAGHIVRVLTIFEANDTAYTLMEYLPGQNLDARLAQAPGGLPPAELDRLLRGLLQGLAVVHEAGLAHRDIKPANVILRADGQPVLIDFGSARVVEREGDHSFTQIYSAGYAPIEQILGTTQGPFSDIYAVGVIGYRAIGGRVVRALGRHNAALTGKPDPLRPAAEVGAGRYPAALLAMLDKALIVAPEQRPASAEAMLRLLDAAPPRGDVLAGLADDATVLRPGVAPPRRPATPTSAAQSPAARRGKAWRWLAAGGAGLAMAAVLVMLLPGTTPTSPAAAAPPRVLAQASGGAMDLPIAALPTSPVTTAGPSPGAPATGAPATGMPDPVSPAPPPEIVSPLPGAVPALPVPPTAGPLPDSPTPAEPGGFALADPPAAPPVPAPAPIADPGPDRLAALPPRPPEPSLAAPRVVLRAQDLLRVMVGEGGGGAPVVRVLYSGESLPLGPREEWRLSAAALANLVVLVDGQPLPPAFLPAPVTGPSAEPQVLLEEEDLVRRATLAAAAPPPEPAKPGAGRILLQARRASFIMIKDTNGRWVLTPRWLPAGDSWSAPRRANIVLTVLDRSTLDIRVDGRLLPFPAVGEPLKQDITLDPDALLRQAAQRAALPPPAAPPGASRILLQVRREVWMSVQHRDNRVPLIANWMRAGDNWPVPPRPGLVLSVQERDALDILVDGRLLPGPAVGEPRNQDITLDADALLRRAGLAVPPG